MVKAKEEEEEGEIFLVWYPFRLLMYTNKVPPCRLIWVKVLLSSFNRWPILLQMNLEN